MTSMNLLSCWAARRKIGESLNNEITKLQLELSVEMSRVFNEGASVSREDLEHLDHTWTKLRKLYIAEGLANRPFDEAS